MIHGHIIRRNKIYKMKKLLLYFFLSCAPLLANAQKPILPDFHADPSIHFWDGKFWLYPSTDEPNSTSWKQMCRWSCYSSEDLVHWKDEGQIFDLDHISWASEAAFAPDAMKWQGKYYYYFPAGFKIGVAVSDKPNGPFKDALGHPLIENRELKSVNTFDPCIFIDEDHTPYLYYGGGGGCAVTRLGNDMISRVGKLHQLELPHYAEGIWVYMHDGVYYFTYPTHIHRNGKVNQLLVYCTAPGPMGPFTYHGAFLDNHSRNSHHSIIEVDGKSYLFYHVEGTSGYDRRVCVDRLYYRKDGTIKPVKMTKKGIKPIHLKKSPL